MRRFAHFVQERRPVFWVGLFLAAFLLILALWSTAEGAPYANPFWTSTTSSPESPLREVAALEFLREGDGCRETCQEVSVNVRTGELVWDFCLLDAPGKVEDNRIALRWRSMLSGVTQVGRQVLPSWETTAQKVIVDAQNPNGNGGHYVRVRRPTGQVHDFTWNGSAYAAPTNVFDALTTNGSGNYVLTDKWGNDLTFDANGMPSLFEDRNGNQDAYTYNGSLQLTGITDDRGKSYTTTRNAEGYVTAIQDFAGRSWALGYDASNNLTTITTPATPDQPSGVTVTLGYDGSNRLTSITDGRGNAVWGFAYNGSSGQVSSVTLNGQSTTFSYVSGRTDRTDRNGNVHRYHHSGGVVTQTDFWIASQAKYVTQYRYTNGFLTAVVFPRGNRVDFAYDGNGDVTERRHRTTDTSTNDGSDLVHQWTYNAANFLTGYTDPRGNSWSYGRDAAGNLTSVTNPQVSSPVTQTSAVALVYNGSGQLTSRTDEEGVVTSFEYHASGNGAHLLHKARRDPNGLNLTTEFSYDAAGNVASRKDARGNATSFTWDNLRRLVETQAPSPLGYRTKYKYDGNGNLVQRDVENVDKDGNVVTGNPWWTTTYAYTNTNDLASVTEEVDASTTRTTSFQYDAKRNRIRVTKPEGNKEKWEYDARDLVVKHVRGETSAVASEEEYVYDDNGNLTTFEDARDNDTTHTYDLFDRRTKTTNALGHFTEWDFDKNGNATEVRVKSGAGALLQRTTRYFDERNRLWKTSDLFKDSTQTYADAVTVYERRKTGEVKKVTNPRGKDTTYTFDAAGRRYRVTDPMGNERTDTLDGNGNATAWTILEKDGGSTVTHGYEAVYDVLDRMTQRKEVDRTNASNVLVTHFYRDSRSNLVFLKNAEGNPTRWTFDGLNRMVKREVALALGQTIDDFTAAQVTQWTFDRNDRLTAHKDDANNTSTWEYDAKDRPIRMAYPDATDVEWTYDAADNVVQTVDPSGNDVDDTYDALNRRTARTVTLVSSFLDTTSESFAYDAADRLTSAEDNDYRVEFEYAVIGLDSHLHKETQSYVGGTAYAKTVTKTFDAAGNKVSETYPSGSNLSLAYAYNDVDALASVSDGTNTVASYTWVGVREKDTTFQSGAKRKNVYTGFRGELESVRHETGAGATLLRLDYGYDKNHDRLYERYGAAGSAGDAFAYDKARRLTTAWMGSATPSAPSGAAYTKKIDYNYDDDGNRTSVVTTPYQQSPSTTSYTTNNLYEYTSVGGVTHGWDLNGNLTDNGTYKFKYNYKNLICEVRNRSTNALVASYRYDALGNRVEKNVGGTVERYVLSKAEQTSMGIECWHVVATFDGSNAWRQNFVYRDAIDGLVMLEQKDILDFDSDGNTTEVTRHFYHVNALGSVMALSDMNQAVAVSYRYEPYGKVTITRNGQPQTTDPLGQHWAFTGRFLDEESGLLYYRARYYDPGLGRFLQRDPLGYAVGPNLFEYGRSSPFVGRDPSGQGPIEHVTEDSRSYDESAPPYEEPEPFDVNESALPIDDHTGSGGGHPSDEVVPDVRYPGGFFGGGGLCGGVEAPPGWPWTPKGGWRSPYGGKPGWPPNFPIPEGPLEKPPGGGGGGGGTSPGGGGSGAKPPWWSKIVRVAGQILNRVGGLIIIHIPEEKPPRPQVA